MAYGWACSWEPQGTSVLAPVQAGPSGAREDAGSLDWGCGHCWGAGVARKQARPNQEK
jgi:hypothetical protein